MTVATSGVLLDVNVLVALAWPSHVHHAVAHAWFRKQQQRGWATCAMTQVAFVRVSSNRGVIPYAVSPAEALDVLERITGLEGHEFWPDEQSAVIAKFLEPSLVVGHQQVTDAYLLALAISRDAALATLDRALHRLAPKGRAAAVQTIKVAR